jgi:hypothetical protein
LLANYKAVDLMQIHKGEFILVSNGSFGNKNPKQDSRTTFTIINKNTEGSTGIIGKFPLAVKSTHLEP